MAELVQEGIGGFRFAAGDAEDLARVLARIADDPAVLTQVRQRLPQVQSIDRDAAWMEERYRSILARPR
jgi:hypothetical protein